MAKELPYFKFEPGQWDNGRIQMCPFEAQGIFINLCSMYWQRLGDLPYKLAVQKICNGNATALKSLSDEGVIKVIDGMICIDFLNEQLAEFGNLSKTNSENARSGWEKRKNNATALRPESERNAIREEKRREEKKKKEENNNPPLRAFQIPFVVDSNEYKAWLEWEKFRKEKGQSIKPTSAKQQFKFLGGRAGPEIVAILEQSIRNGWTGLFELKTNGNGKDSRGIIKGTIRRADATLETPADFGNF